MGRTWRGKQKQTKKHHKELRKIRQEKRSNKEANQQER